MPSGTLSGFISAMMTASYPSGRLIMEHPDNWNYDFIKTLQDWLRPLLDALRRLCEEGLTAALILLRSTIDGYSH